MYVARGFIAVQTSLPFDWVNTALMIDVGLCSASSSINRAGVLSVHAMAQDMRPLTPPVKRSMENLTFSTPSAHLYEDNEHSLWSSSFTSDRAACEARPRCPAQLSL